MSRALEAEYRYLIRRALKQGDPALAQQLREHAFDRYDLDLIDYQG